MPARENWFTYKEDYTMFIFGAVVPHLTSPLLQSLGDAPKAKRPAAPFLIRRVHDRLCLLSPPLHLTRI